MEVNNKRRITLTIIGVTTLLILVLSATFAYFSAQTSNDKETTNVTASTEKVGSIALSNPTGDLHLNLSVSDMAQDNLNTYWATDDESKNYDSEEEQREIAVAELSGGSATAKYECTTTISVELSDTMASKLQPGDAYIQFGGKLNQKVDLTSISADGYNVTFLLDGTNTKKQRVTAAIALENRNADQSYLAGSKLGITFSNSDLECQVVGSSKYKGSKLSEAIMAMSEEDGSNIYHETGTGTYNYKSIIAANESEWTSVNLTGNGEITSNEETDEWIFQANDGEEETEVTFVPLEDKHYYIHFSESSNGFFNGEIKIYIDGKLVGTNLEGELDSTFLNLGNLTSDNTIKLVGTSWGGNQVQNFHFSYLATAAASVDAGYRYEGLDVNNYVTFNDETWRIIGVEEGSNIGINEGTYYTKIIRNDMFGTISEWELEIVLGYSMLGVLNNDYYSKTDDEMDFTETGLSEESRNLLVKPKWYNITYDEVSTTSNTYAAEKNVGTSESRYVGLMSPSDYGYAALQSECKDTLLTSYGSCGNWLNNGKIEFLLSADELAEEEGDVNWYVLTKSADGSIVRGSAYTSAYYRPVVYLNSDVMIINNGTGEMDNPYEISL